MATVEPTVATTPTSNNPPEVLYIKPHVVELPFKGGLLKKGGAHKGQLGGSLALDVSRAVAGGGGKKGVADKRPPHERDFCVQLSQLRETAVSALGDPAWTADAVDTAVAEYLALLQGLTCQHGKPPSNPLTDGATIPPSRPSRVPPIASSLSFHWYDIFDASTRTDNPPVSGDAAMELSSVLLSLAVWKARAAAKLCNRPKFSEGVSSDESSAAYKLLRQAAGLAALLVEMAACGASSPPSASHDLCREKLSALELLFLADAQSLSTLRAVEKGNSPAIVASVARDTSELYASALKRLQSDNSGAGWTAKVAAYAEFKAEAFRAHANIANGKQRLADEAAGDAVRSAEEAKGVAAAAAKLGTVYDKAGGVLSDPKEHEFFSAHLRATVQHSADKILRMNSMIHYKAPSPDLPALPDPTRLAQPLPYALPPLSELAISLVSSSSSNDDEGQGIHSDAATTGAEQATTGAEGEGGGGGGDGKPAEDGASGKPESPPKGKSCCCVVQ
uniref:BRO1 domain-containing protein n=1 Tax=Tetraselmis chuii TaxID=63592 RepID=A0A7S1SVS8_9CHLO|mmetsp:Transcript_28199/g.50409  ORF Transcript_28199/g.50409 Transcript_28199/m.50409 type:complete len:505 (+) Transcript_28199:208-1722(+)